MNIQTTISICLFLFLVGCNFAQDKSYYSQFKNENLSYTWEFNPALNESGGHTYNSTYFEIKKYIFPNVSAVPYETQYKHEEGHILLGQERGIEDMDKWELEKFGELNLTDHDDYRKYIISVDEGLADVYMFTYFNDSRSKKYREWIFANKKTYAKAQQHYQGSNYVYYAVNNGIYPDLKAIRQDFGSREQYYSYKKFLQTFSPD
ncbi:MAG: hypothetical protein Q7K43_03805 [Candidatus Woesearchaeota archaeon]|nr:hypothetical protein [Candidatus Woesearchaeota archaeon]